MKVQVDERRENPWRRRKMGMFCLKTEEVLRMDPLWVHWCMW